jgi:hypothetical protein
VLAAVDIDEAHVRAAALRERNDELRGIAGAGEPITDAAARQVAAPRRPQLPSLPRHLLVHLQVERAHRQDSPRATS